MIKSKKIKYKILDNLDNKKTYYILEWNSLDDDIDLYIWKTIKDDGAEIYEDINEGLHNLSDVLIMNKKQFDNLKKIVNQKELNVIDGDEE